MEQVGNLIINLHRNLQEIQATLDTSHGQTREQQLLQDTIEHAEATLRAQAQDIVNAARTTNAGLTGRNSNTLAASLGVNYPQRRSESQRRLAQSDSFQPAPPQGRPPVPPSHRGMMEDPGHRSASLDAMRRRPLRAPSGGQRLSERNSNRQRLLPRANRLDPLADPPALTEKDMESGLLNLSNRGFIPASADLTPAMERGFPVIMQRPSPLYDSAMRFQTQEVASADNLLSVKLDLREPVRYISPDSRRMGNGYDGSSPQVRSSRQLVPLAKPPPMQRDTDSAASATMLSLPAPVPDPVQSGSGWAGQAYGTFCTELLDAADEFSASQALVEISQPAGPNEHERREAAATRIGSRLRGWLQRRKFAVKLRHHRAAKFIQSAWHSAVVRTATREELMRREDEARKLQTQMLFELGQDWFQAKALRRVEVHVCSLTVPESRRGRMDSYQALQSVQIARIFRLADAKRDIIFVAPKALHEDILDYYAKIMQFRGIKNPPGRFQVVVPENMGLTPNMSLTQGLLCSPKALKRIRKLVSNRMGILIPGAVSHAEAKLSSTLKLPLLGAGARNMSLLASKSNAKKLTQIAELPTGPWAVDIYDEDEFYTCLAGLVVKFPKVRTWVFKIDDERDSRGHAYIDLAKMRQVNDTVRSTAPEGGQAMAGLGSAGGGDFGGSSSSTGMPSGPGTSLNEDEEPAVIGADANEVRTALQRLVPRRAVLCNRRVHGDFAGWLAEACRTGCVIQAVPENMISQTSVHLQVAPDGSIDVLGTSEAVMSQPFVRAASWYPHTRGSFEVLQEVAHRMGRVLAAKGLVGFASIDVVFFDNPEFDAAQLVQQRRAPSPAIIGSDTPVDRDELMFGNLRSPSPDMSSAGGDMRPRSSASLPESRQADYEMAMQIHEEQMRAGNQPLDPVSLILGGGGSSQHVGASGASPFACWIVDVDARLTDEAAMIFPLQFVAQVKVDPSSGFLQLTPEAPQPADEEAARGSRTQLSDEDKLLRSQRWALVSSVAMAPQLERMSYQSLFQAAKMRGVSFDLFHNVGCIFTFLDVVHKLFSLLAVEKSPEQCAKRMSAAVAAMAEGAPQKGPGGARPGGPKIVAAPRDAPTPLGREDEASDILSIADVQLALRLCLKRWADKKSNP